MGWASPISLEFTSNICINRSWKLKLPSCLDESCGFFGWRRLGFTEEQPKTLAPENIINGERERGRNIPDIPKYVNCKSRSESVRNTKNIIEHAKLRRKNPHRRPHGNFPHQNGWKRGRFRQMASRASLSSITSSWISKGCFVSQIKILCASFPTCADQTPGVAPNPFSWMDFFRYAPAPISSFLSTS